MLLTYSTKKKKKKSPALACYLLINLIAAIYLATFPVAFKVSVMTALLFLCPFGLGLDWLSVGGGGAFVVTSSLEHGYALCTVG